MFAIKFKNYSCGRDLDGQIHRTDRPRAESTLKCELYLNHISSYSADNASANSVFQKFTFTVILLTIVLNIIKGLDVDVENVVTKIYNEFSSSFPF